MIRNDQKYVNIFALCIVMTVYAIIADHDMARYIHKYRLPYFVGLALFIISSSIFIRRTQISHVVTWIIVAPFVGAIIGYAAVSGAFFIEHGYVSKGPLAEWLLIAAFMPYIATKAWVISILTGIVFIASSWLKHVHPRVSQER